MSRTICLFALLLVGVLITSCATTQTRYVMLDRTYPSRPEDCDMKVFRTGKPGIEFVKISRLDVHLEKTSFVKSEFEDALPHLKKQACRSGADAIIDVEERTSLVGETHIYHVTATGIKYIE